MKLKNVLVVDDEPLMRDTLELGLRSEFRVVKARSGMEALEFVDKETFPVVVLDLRMEGLDGIATLKHLRHRDACQKIVILTAHQSMDTAIEAVNLGAHGYFTKPCDLKKLKGVLSEAHDRYYAEQQRLDEFRQRLLTMHDDFFAVLCHEFNTPLNGIIGFASILKEELEDKERGRMAGFIEDTAKDLHETFMEILDYINSKAPGEHLANEPFSPQDLEQKLDASRYSAKVNYEFVGDFWTSGDCFVGPLYSLSAILANSVLAGVPGNDPPVQIYGSFSDGKITFRLINLDLESRFGTPDDLDAIFSPYTTSRAARRRFDPGVGLHLATSRNLADTEGIRLEARKNDDGRIDIYITAELLKIENF